MLFFMPNNNFEESMSYSIQKPIPNQTLELYISTAISSQYSMKNVIKKRE